MNSDWGVKKDEKSEDNVFRTSELENFKRSHFYEIFETDWRGESVSRVL